MRLAVIGLGAVARNLHFPAYARLGTRVTVVGGCDPDPAARAVARSRWRVPDVFDDARTMLEASRPDIVAVCSPPALHREHALAALEQGCHVFCEKPLATDLAEAEQMIRAAERAGRWLVVNNQFPAMRIHAEAKRLIGTPEFGRLLYLHAWHTMTPSAETEAGWRGELRRRLGFEFGVHVFELIRFFFEDRPRRILAHMPNPLGASRSDVINVVVVEFADGRAASVVLDRLSKGPERYLDVRLDGELASIRTSIGGRVALRVGVHTRQRRPFVDWSVAGGGQAVRELGTRRRVIARDRGNPFAAATERQLGGLLHAIDTGGVPPGHARDNWHTLAMVFAAYESAESARWVDLARYPEPA